MMAATNTPRYNGGSDERLDITFRGIPGNTWGAKLSSCLRCECCARHMDFRPVTLEPWVEPLDGWPSSGKVTCVGTACVCPCRHNARFICRQVEPACVCPVGSPREVEVLDVLTPGERVAWLDHLDRQELEAALQSLSH